MIAVIVFVVIVFVVIVFVVIVVVVVASPRSFSLFSSISFAQR